VAGSDGSRSGRPLLPYPSGHLDRDRLLMPLPRVSVILAVRNGEPYLRESVESVLLQTFTDLELVVVDDGSTDRTWEIVSEYARLDSRVVPLRNEVNRGQPYTRNRAIGVARGEYVAIQDADDISLPGRLAAQVAFLDAHPRVGTLACAVEEFRDDGRRSKVVFGAAEDPAIRARLLISTCFPHSSLCARTELVRAIDGYRAEFTYAQDYDLACRLSERAEVRCLPEVLVRYRVGHPGSISRDRVAQQYDTVRSISLEQLRRTFPGLEIDEEAHRAFWWAIHGGRVRLTSGHLDALAPVWRAMKADAAIATEIGRVLVEKVYYHPGLGTARVLRLARTEFGARVPWGGLALAWCARTVSERVVKPLRRLGGAGAAALRPQAQDRLTGSRRRRFSARDTGSPPAARAERGGEGRGES
jgi:glycosyltransferase involved in cell wall biosynthesis